MESNDLRSPSPPAGYTISPWLVMFFLGLSGILVYRTIQDWMPSAVFDPNAQPRTVAARGDLAQDEQAAIELFKSASQSVAYVTSLNFQRDRSMNLLEVPSGSGSGFVWDEQGHIVTNFHVVQSARAWKVSLADNSSWDARLVATEPDKDLAVLKIDAPKSRLKPIPVGESHTLQVGQKVFAIGSPFSLDQTLTTGVVSGLGREIRAVTGNIIYDVIQTDAAINPGNSGGPLLDSAGRLIGVNTAIYSPSGAYAGVGFAVPVDTVNRVVPQLVRGESRERPSLGVRIFEDSAVNRLIGTKALKEEGVLVRDVLPNSAAQKAGILGLRTDEDGDVLLGDLIVSMDGKPIKSTKDLHKLLDSHEVGDEVSLQVKRDDQTIDLKARLQPLQQATE